MIKIINNVMVNVISSGICLCNTMYSNPVATKAKMNDNLHTIISFVYCEDESNFINASFLESPDVIAKRFIFSLGPSTVS